MSIASHLNSKQKQHENILKMLEDNVNNEQIAKYTGVSEEFVKKVSEKQKE